MPVPAAPAVAAISHSYLKEHRWSLLVLFGSVLLPLLLFGRLAETVHQQGGLPFDVPLLRWIHTYANPRRDHWVALVTLWGYWGAIPVLAVVALGLRWVLRQTSAAVFFALAGIGSWGLDVAAKLIFGRARPALWTSPSPEFDYSFPSGHAMVSMTIAAALVILAWPTRLRWPALLAAIPCVLVIGLSRLYLGVHYPSDILAGWTAALCWVSGVRHVMRRHLGAGPSAPPQTEAA